MKRNKENGKGKKKGCLIAFLIVFAFLALIIIIGSTGEQPEEGSEKSAITSSAASESDENTEAEITASDVSEEETSVSEKEIGKTSDTTTEKSTQKSETTKSTTKQTTKTTTEVVRQTTQKPTTKTTTKATVKKTAAPAAQYDFVANINSGKYHYSWCASVKRMNEGNKRFYHCSSSEMRAMGYDPCENCNP